MMIRIANQIAKNNQFQILLTGESIGQVSSQTLENISVIENVTQLPILRPVITMNKQEIVELAKKINTYDISILPHEDCCTLFVPRHPATKPRLKNILANEKKLAVDKLCTEAASNPEIQEF